MIWINNIFRVINLFNGKIYILMILILICILILHQYFIYLYYNILINTVVFAGQYISYYETNFLHNVKDH